MRHKSTAALSRRRFLKQTALLGGAAVAAPDVITSNALGGEGRPPASERIVIGHIGMGWFGTHDLKAFLTAPDAQNVAVCDVEVATDPGELVGVLLLEFLDVHVRGIRPFSTGVTARQVAARGACCSERGDGCRPFPGVARGPAVSRSGVGRWGGDESDSSTRADLVNHPADR